MSKKRAGKKRGEEKISNLTAPVRVSPSVVRSGGGLPMQFVHIMLGALSKRTERRNGQRRVWDEGGRPRHSHIPTPKAAPKGMHAPKSV